MIGRLFLVIGVTLTFLLLDGCEGKWLLNKWMYKV